MRRDLVLHNTPAEWNIRVLSEDDFYQYCDEAGIIIYEKPLETSGLYICQDNKPEIYLHNELRGADRLFVAYHELAHHWLHPSGTHMYHAGDEEWSAQSEDEADLVAICCLIPATILPHYHPSEIVELHGYRLDQVKFRCEVFDKWKI